MYFSRSILLILCLFSLMGCQEDLNPDSEDIRQEEPSQAINFIAPTTIDSQNIELREELENYDAVVLYFTMWCPSCNAHMSHMRFNVINEYPNVRFLMVDYVSESILSAERSQMNSGYASMTVLFNKDNVVSELFNKNKNMAITVVIDKDSNILMNESYKNGERLKQTLTAL